MTAGLMSEVRCQPLFRNRLSRENVFVYRVWGTGIVPIVLKRLINVHSVTSKDLD